MIKILAIGNSFSEDATAYLHDIATSGNVDTLVVNLYIGGCPLKLHWENVQSNACVYQYQINGVITDKLVSIQDTICSEDWDYITMQQASHDSGFEDTYYPYVTELSHYIKKLAPNAKQLIHQTWSYEIDSDHEAFPLYQSNQAVMYEALKKAYSNASNSLGIKQIRCGDVIQMLRSTAEFDYKNGGKSICRDGFHLNIPYGRYAAALTWYKTITQESVLDTTFLPPEADQRLIDLIKKSVNNF